MFFRVCVVVAGDNLRRGDGEWQRLSRLVLSQMAGNVSHSASGSQTLFLVCILMTLVISNWAAGTVLVDSEDCLVAGQQVWRLEMAKAFSYLARAALML